jgi:hypothetical protein
MRKALIVTLIVLLISLIAWGMFRLFKKSVTIAPGKATPQSETDKKLSQGSEAERVNTQAGTGVKDKNGNPVKYVGFYVDQQSGNLFFQEPWGRTLRIDWPADYNGRSSFQELGSYRPNFVEFIPALNAIYNSRNDVFALREVLKIPSRIYEVDAVNLVKYLNSEAPLVNQQGSVFVKAGNSSISLPPINWSKYVKDVTK